MAKAVGVGGIFFRADDTVALAAWYKTHLGVTDLWGQEGGLTVFAPFKRNTDYFPADKQWMVNFRVDDLDALIGQLKAAGIAVETRPGEWDSPRPGGSPASTIPKGTPSSSGSLHRRRRRWVSEGS